MKVLLSKRLMIILAIVICMMSACSSVDTSVTENESVDTDLEWYLVKEVSSGGSVIEYSYNDMGLVLCRSVCRDEEFVSSNTYEYDELGRVASDENLYFDIEHNQIVDVKEYTYEGENTEYSRLVESTGYVEERRFDSDGRVVFREVSVDGELIFSFTYEYLDGNGSYLEYNTQGELSSKKVCDANGNIVEDITYDSEGREAGRVLYEYDEHNEQINVTSGDEVIWSAETEYNDDGLLITFTKYDADGSLFSEGYAKIQNTYDEYKNLIKVEYFDGNGASISSTGYTYSTDPTEEVADHDDKTEMNIDFASTHNVTELGIAYDYESFDGTQAAIPWDIKVFDGCLYVGAGDYSNNKSPISVRRYNFDKEAFEKCGTLLEECYQRFVVLDGSLVIPGCDPREGWEFGNYYVLNDDGMFDTVRTIPGGVHNFDMLIYDGKIFAGLGIDSGDYPVAVSSDGGKTFEQIVCYKDGVAIDTGEGNEYRAIDLVVLDGKLYAIFLNNLSSTSVYVYENDRFEYMCPVQDLYQISISQPANKTVYNDKLYYANRKELKVSSDMTQFDTIVLDGAEYVTDVLEYNGGLYVMGYTKISSASYVTAIFKLNSEDAFEMVASFEYDLPAYSFDIHDGVVYLGFADGLAVNNSKKTGMIGYITLD